MIKLISLKFPLTTRLTTFQTISKFVQPKKQQQQKLSPAVFLSPSSLHTPHLQEMTEIIPEIHNDHSLVETHGDPLHPASLICDLCSNFYKLGWVSISSIFPSLSSRLIADNLGVFII